MIEVFVPCILLWLGNCLLARLLMMMRMRVTHSTRMPKVIEIQFGSDAVFVAASASSPKPRPHLSIKS